MRLRQWVARPLGHFVFLFNPRIDGRDVQWFGVFYFYTQRRAQLFAEVWIVLLQILLQLLDLVCGLFIMAVAQPFDQFTIQKIACNLRKIEMLPQILDRPDIRPVAHLQCVFDFSPHHVHHRRHLRILSGSLCPFLFDMLPRVSCHGAGEIVPSAAKDEHINVFPEPPAAASPAAREKSAS